MVVINAEADVLVRISTELSDKYYGVVLQYPLQHNRSTSANKRRDSVERGKSNSREVHAVDGFVVLAVVDAVTLWASVLI